MWGHLTSSLEAGAGLNTEETGDQSVSQPEQEINDKHSDLDHPPRGVLKEAEDLAGQ